MILSDKAFGMIGFATRAGKVTFGSFACDKGVKAGKIALLIVDEGASERTKKDMRNMCEYYATDIIFSSPIGELSGRCGRKDTIVAGITDTQFANRIKEIVKDDNAEV